MMMLSRAIPVCVAVLALAAAGCDKMPLSAPTDSTVTVSAASSFVPTGGTTEVTAFVAESSGTPVHNGTTVRFTTNLGRIEPVEAQTRSGYATATFVAGDLAGVADVRATSGGIGGSTGDNSAASNAVQITVGGAAATTVLVSASPSSVPAGGGTVTIIASVLDANGNRLRNIPVSFSADRGALSPTFANTDGNGEARVQLTTNQETVVTARAGAAENPGTVTVTVGTSVTISVDTTAAASSRQVTITITPGQGSAVARVVVDFGDDNQTDLGSIQSETRVTHQYANSGTYPIRVTQTNQDGSSSAAVQVVVIP